MWRQQRRADYVGAWTGERAYAEVDDRAMRIIILDRSGLSLPTFSLRPADCLGIRFLGGYQKPANHDDPTRFHHSIMQTQ